MAEALSRKNVGVVIGYGAGTLENQTIPVHITDSSDCEKLVWNQGCRNNLSTYIGLALEENERVAVVAKTCDLGALSAAGPNRS